ncbi:transmembrane protein 163 [Danio aesculapii]|uniref:transmembrane protein 163 n=1 Tax=Danio aesculapii TaxID=1142201 RepID=UPI0024C04098|nr:transmembrane protein 163 [Danio aesculapii]
MTDSSSASDPTAGPVDPCPAPSAPDTAVEDPASTPANGHHPNQADSFNMEQQMKIGEPEDNGLLESSMRLKPHEAQNYRKKALWVSWVSIVVTMILAIAAFTVSIMRHSASAFGFAFDATLDVLSSIIVLWRYSNAAAVHSAHREYIACVILGVVFILSAITILVKAIHDLATKLEPEVPFDLKHGYSY